MKSWVGALVGSIALAAFGGCRRKPPVHLPIDPMTLAAEPPSKGAAYIMSGGGVVLNRIQTEKGASTEVSITYRGVQSRYVFAGMPDEPTAYFVKAISPFILIGSATRDYGNDPPVPGWGYLFVIHVVTGTAELAFASPLCDLSTLAVGDFTEYKGGRIRKWVVDRFDGSVVSGPWYSGAPPAKLIPFKLLADSFPKHSVPVGHGFILTVQSPDVARFGEPAYIALEWQGGASRTGCPLGDGEVTITATPPNRNWILMVIHQRDEGASKPGWGRAVLAYRPPDSHDLPKVLPIVESNHLDASRMMEGILVGEDGPKAKTWKVDLKTGKVNGKPAVFVPLDEVRRLVPW